MLISPTEPAALRAIGKVSLATEEYGADIVIFSKEYGAVGIQRKEVSDLVHSVRDGRLGKQVVQMKGLGLAVVLIEGKLQWTRDGSLVGRLNWTQAQHHGLMLSLQSRGIWLANVESLESTIAWLLMFQKWLQKPRHTSLETRPKGRDEFGKEVTKGRDFGIHLLQSFPGVGREVAARIVDHFQGLPIRWTITAEELTQVRGIGASRAAKLIGMLGEDMGARLSSSSDEFAASPLSSRKGKVRAAGTQKARATQKSGTSPTESFAYIELDET